MLIKANRFGPLRYVKGFSLTAILVSMAIVGITFSSFISILSAERREVKIIKRKLASMSLESSILQALRHPDVCSCHFDSIQAAGINIIDTSVNPINDIDLGTFRGSCDFSDTASNVIATVGQEIEGGEGLSIKSVRIADIEKIDRVFDLYRGDLTIEYNPENVAFFVHPIKVPLIFSVDPRSGTETAGLIHSCWGVNRESNSEGLCRIMGEISGQILIGCE